MSQQVNLYQPIFRKEERKFSSVAMLQGAGLLFAGILMMYAYTQWQVRSLRAELAQSEQNHVAATKRLDEVVEKFGGGRKPSLTMDEEIVRLEQEIAARQRIQEFLQRGIFRNTHGFSEYFVSLARQRVSGLWLTGFDIVGAGEQVSLRGRSTNPELVPRYMQKLSREKSLSGIEFHVFQLNRPAVGTKGASAQFVEFQAKTTGNPG